MVNFFLPLFTILLTLASSNVHGDDVSVITSLEKARIEADHPIKGMISITHSKNDKVDLSSFRLGNTPMTVQFVQDTQISPSSDLIISFYSFYLEGKKKGLYLLSEVSVKVGDKVYKSIPSTFEIEDQLPPNVKNSGSPHGASPAKPEASPAKSSSTTPEAAANQVILKLESIVRPNLPIYPGQTIQLVYRYFFNDNIELTEEKLPLLDAPGFVKIGSRQVKDSEEGDFSIREISQLVSADKPGKYEFQGAVVKGFAYITEANGERKYLKPSLQAVSPPLAIVVNPFPEEGKPPSFNGAIGPFTSFTVTLMSSPTPTVEDKVLLGLDIKGSGNLLSLPMPELCCQPGFSGFFQQSDLPPSEKIEGDTKHFEVELRPLTDKINEIPSIELAYFDPVKKAYAVLKSKVIPLQIQVKASSSADEKTPNSQELKESGQGYSKTPLPIDINGQMEMEREDLNNPWYYTWQVLLLIPVGLALLLAERLLQITIQKKRLNIPKPTSADFFARALKIKHHSSAF